MLENDRQCSLLLISLILCLFAGSKSGSASVSVMPLTDNPNGDTWGAAHSTVVGDRVIWAEDNQRVWYYDGATATPVQDFDDGVPELDLVATFVFGLGSGAAAGEVIGAWRRGADYAWVWTSGQAPVLIDTAATNPFVQGGATNPEGIAIADGCVFLITQAQDPGDGTSNIYKNVFQVSPADGSVTPVSGNQRAFGADRVRTSGCRAVWVQDVNDNILVGDQPYELQYWDGAQTVTLDSGEIDKLDLDFEDGKVVYIKHVEGRGQVFLLDLADSGLVPRQLTDTLAAKASPQTDGRHVAWGEEVGNPEPESFGLMDVRLLGGLRVAPRAALRPYRAMIGYVLDGGQLAWQARGEVGTADLLFYLADNQRELLDPAEHGTFLNPYLSDGWLGWYGYPPGQNDTDVSLGQGAPPQDLSLAPPPVYVEAVPGPGEVTIRWDEVLDVDSYTVYLAEESGLTPGNYDTLQGGERFPAATSPLTVGNLDASKTYYAIVTTTENGTEGPASGEAETYAIVVDTTDDTIDVDSMDSVCQDSQGNCSLRAALMHASASDDRGPTIVVPAGVYILSLQGSDDAGEVGDLDVRGPVTVVGSGIDETIVHGGGSAEAIFHVDPAGDGFLVRLVDLTVGNAARGIVNEGELRLDRVRVRDNGTTASFAIGAAILHRDAERMELFDCELDGNVTSSHGGALLLGAQTDIWRTTIHDNLAGLGGGAAYIFGGDIRLTDSLLGDNSTRLAQNWPGGAINQEKGTLMLRRTAVVDNDSPACGGGLFQSSGLLTLVNSTVSGNHSDAEGGAICTGGGTTILIGSTLAGNTATTYPTLELGSGTILNLDYSILRNELGMPDCHFNVLFALKLRGQSFGHAGNCTADPLVSMADPRLDLLADNGGHTPTHALFADSPALDAVAGVECMNRFDEPLNVDQRSAPRPIDNDDDGDARCDSGAYEAAVACIDADGDGFPTIESAGCFSAAPVDCDDTDGQSWATPGENSELRFIDAQTLVWDAPADPGGTAGALVHLVARSEDAFDFSVAGVCSTTAPGVTGDTDTAVPPVGTTYFYLTRATNACPGTSSWGRTSQGTERSVACP